MEDPFTELVQVFGEHRSILTDAASQGVAKWIRRPQILWDFTYLCWNLTYRQQLNANRPIRRCVICLTVTIG